MISGLPHLQFECFARCQQAHMRRTAHIWTSIGRSDVCRGTLDHCVCLALALAAFSAEISFQTAGDKAASDKMQTQAQCLYSKAVAHFNIHLPVVKNGQLTRPAVRPQSIQSGVKKGSPLKQLILTHDSFRCRSHYPYQLGAFNVSPEAVADYHSEVYCCHPR